MSTHHLAKRNSSPSFKRLPHTLGLLAIAAALACTGCNDGGGNSQNARAELTKMGKDYSPDEFVMCAGKGDVAAVKLFLDAGMALRGRIQISGGKDMDALFAACQNGQEPVARILLEHGADPNATSMGGQTPLAAAAGQGNTGIIALLLAKGAKIDAPGAEGLNPLMAAAANGKEAAAKLLIQKGAAVDAGDPAGITALMQAATYNQTGIIEALLGAGAKVDKTNKDGRTALMHAAFRGNVEAAKMLVEHHARLDVTDPQGKTAMDYAKGDVADVLRGAAGAPK